MFDVTDFGARADGIIDDAPAFQAALTEATMRGGMVFVPPGLYRWASPVAVDFEEGGTGNRGFSGLLGPGAVVLMQTAGAPFVALSARNASTFLIEGMKFYGSMDKQNPTTQPAGLAGVIRSDTLVVRDSEFNGFQISNPGGYALSGDNAILHGTRLVVERCRFASVGGSGRPMILARRYVDLRVADVTFVDFYTLDSVEMKTTQGEYPYTAIYAVDPDPTTGASQFGATTVTIDNVRLDEGVGGMQQLTVSKGFGDKRRVPFVRIRGLTQAVAPLVSSIGVAIDGAERVSIEDWFVREGNVRGSVCLDASNIQSLDIRRTITDPNSRISAVRVEPTVGITRLTDSHLDRAGIRSARLVDLDL